MANKKEIKEVLKELNLTEEQMDKYSNELMETNRIISGLYMSGKTWRDLNTHVIKQIPTQRKKDLKRIENEKIEVEKQKEMEKKIIKGKEYYEKNFEKIMIKKIEKKEELTEREIKKLIFEYQETSDYGENRRWTRTVKTLVNLKGRYFVVEWEEALTESQENEFWEQPYEVEKKICEKTIVVEEWIKKEKGE